jgi:hypothetical protein
MVDFPQLEYPKEVPPLEHSERMRKSINGMTTLFNTKKIPIDKDKFINNQTNDFGIALQEVEKNIANLIDEYILKRKNETLISIFHYIHFWGGITGRNIYNKNGGFDKNFNIETYKKIVEKIIVLKKDTLYTELKIIEKLFTSIPELGISFSTKHLKFWSLYANQDKIQLPVLDSVLTIRLLHKCTPTWKDYNNYLKQMQDESKKNNTTINILERQLYNHFNQNK